MTQYPERAFLVLSDDVRDEANGKKTLIGVYSGGDILLQSNAPWQPNVGISSLAMSVFFQDGSGDFRISEQLIPPSGIPFQIPFPARQVTKVLNANLVVSTKIAPFLIPEQGNYTYVINLNDRRYDFPFLVRFQQIPQNRIN